MKAFITQALPLGKPAVKQHILPKLQLYTRMIVQQFASNVFDLDVETNDLISQMLRQLEFVHSACGYKNEVGLLRDFVFVMDAALIEINDRWQSGGLRSLTSCQVKQVIEARFAASKLRTTMLESIQ